MELPLTITAHDATLTEPVEALIREKTAKLERYFDRIVGCHVTVEGPAKHHRNGGHYRVRIDLSVPGSEIVVNHQEGETLPAAVREAFEAAQRQLQDHVSLRREGRKAVEEV